MQNNCIESIRTLDACVETEVLDNCLVPASFRLATVPLESLEIVIVAVRPDQVIVVDRVALDKLGDDYFVLDLTKSRRTNFELAQIFIIDLLYRHAIAHIA